MSIIFICCSSEFLVEYKTIFNLFSESTEPMLINYSIILFCPKDDPLKQLLDDDGDENNNVEEKVKQKDDPYQEQLMDLGEETQKDQVNKRLIDYGKLK